MQAVDSENKKNLQSDVWRLNQLNKSLSNPEHPYHKFSTGSYETLHDEPLKRGVPIRDEFINFHTKHYSANLMKLAILGSESLDTLESWVTEFFTPVVNKDIEKTRWDSVSPFTDSELATIIYAKPVFEMQHLYLYFPYQDEEDMFDSRPATYLSNLIGHEGPGSVLAFLKAKGWVNSLGSGLTPICTGNAFMTVHISLSYAGLEHYQEVVKVLFQYISLLNESPPEEWIFKEMATMSQVNFRFREKSSASRTVSSLSGLMQRSYPRERLLSAPSVIRQFDGPAIKQALSFLKPDKVRLLLVSQKLPVSLDKKEKWYGTEYKYEKFSDSFFDELKQAAKANAAARPAELFLPKPNEFLPSRLEVEKKDVKTPLSHPKLLRNDNSARLWHKKDDRFWVPRTSVNIFLRSPLANTSPRVYMMGEVYTELVIDALAEYTYAASLAGLHYNLYSHQQGLDLMVDGYNDKLPVLLEKVLLTVRDLEVRDDRFEVVKERLARSNRNFDYQMPYHMVGTYSSWLFHQTTWITEHLRVELPSLTAADIRAFYPEFLRQLHIETLVSGNEYQEDSLKLIGLVKSTLKPAPLPPSQWRVKRSISLPNSSNYVYRRTLQDPANVNHCIDYMLQIGSNQDRSLRAKTMLLAQAAEEPAFDQLRTKEQLGYVVFSGIRVYESTLLYHVLIQSQRQAEYLEQRIDAFLTSLRTLLAEMKPEQFEEHKRSLINERLKAITSLNVETSRFWNRIVDGTYDFEQGKQTAQLLHLSCMILTDITVHRDVENIKPLTLDDLRSFYDYYISPASSTRAKLSVQLLAQSPATAATSRKDVVDYIATELKGFNITVDKEKLGSAMKDIDFTTATTVEGGAYIATAVKTYLVDNAGVASEDADKIVEQGMKSLQALNQSAGDKSTTAEGPQAPQDQAGKNEAILITDVPQWIVGLPLNPAPVPVCDWAELEAKL